MRLSTAQLFSSGLRGMTDLQAQTAKTQEQLATGKKVLTPSDDPVAATRIMQINQELAVNEQYQENIGIAQQQLALEEALLESAGNSIIRIRELTIRAGDGALSLDERRAIAVEISQRLEELEGIANSRGANGEYIFAGYQGNTRPFVQQINGEYAYLGDEGQRFVQISASQHIAVNDSGQDVFIDVPAASNIAVGVAAPGNTASPAANFSVQVANQAAYDAFYPEDLIITFNNPPNNYTVVRESDGSFIGNIPHTGGQSNVTLFGLNVSITGAPAAGERFFVESTPRQGLLATVKKLADGLQTLDDSAAGRAGLQTLIAESLDNLDAGLESVLGVRTEIGARLNVLDTTLAQHQDLALISQETLSKVRDLDYTEAISRLSLQSFVLEAAQQSFLKISQLSLFNFLR
jgi:flagellar hook-associated protein 3 FlgL